MFPPPEDDKVRTQQPSLFSFTRLLRPTLPLPFPSFPFLPMLPVLRPSFLVSSSTLLIGCSWMKLVSRGLTPAVSPERDREDTAVLPDVSPLSDRQLSVKVQCPSFHHGRPV